MKLVVAIVHTEDANGCCDGLTSAGFVCTRFDSFGAFLDRDNVTLMIGVDEPLVDDVLAVLRKTARRRNETLQTGSPLAASVGGGASVAVDVEVGGATVFVVDVARFEKI